VLVESIVTVATLSPEGAFTVRLPAALKKSFPMYAVVKQIALPFFTVSCVE
jgi:hypothetical protein